MEQKTLLSLAEFFALPGDGNDYELVHGELVRMPPQDFEHEFVKSRITQLLILFLETHDFGMVFPETGAVLDEGSWRKPDVSFLRWPRLDRQARNAQIEGAPDLCVEVVSESNTHREIADKTQHFLNSGAVSVWCVYPKTKEVHVVSHSGDRWLGPDEELSDAELLPGFRVQVRSLFERKK
ncbi:MAG: Uma2 family endonuclease [Bryobacteraceae bacterium]